MGGRKGRMDRVEGIRVGPGQGRRGGIAGGVKGKAGEEVTRRISAAFVSYSGWFCRRVILQRDKTDPYRLT